MTYIGATGQADGPEPLLGSLEGLDFGVSVPIGQGSAGAGHGSNGNRQVGEAEPRAWVPRRGDYALAVGRGVQEQPTMHLSGFRRPQS